MPIDTAFAAHAGSACCGAAARCCERPNAPPLAGRMGIGRELLPQDGLTLQRAIHLRIRREEPLSGGWQLG